MFLTRKLQKVHGVRFATVPYPNIYLLKSKPTPPHKINFHTIIIKKLLQNVITQREKKCPPSKQICFFKKEAPGGNLNRALNHLSDVLPYTHLK